MRRVLVALSLCLPLAAAAQKIDFAATGEPLGYAMQRLSDVAQTPLSVDPKLWSLSFACNVKAVELDELLSKIAEATHAEWTERNGRRTLARSAKQERDTKSDSIALRAELFRKSFAVQFEAAETRLDAGVAKLLIQYLEDAGRRKDYWRTYGLTQQGPRQRLLFRLLNSVPIEQLVLDPGESRRVFALNPTKAQLPFGKDALKIYDQYVEEQLIWHNVTEGVDTSGRSDVSQDPLTQRDLPNGPPHNWYVDVRQTLVRILDAGANGSFNSVAEVFIIPAEIGPGQYADAQGRVFKPSKFVKALAESRLSQLSRADHPEVWQRVSDPAKCDIAAVLVGEIAAQWSEGDNWIAMPSSGAANAYRMVAGVTDLPSLLAMVERLGGTKIEKTDGWIVATVQDPYYEQETSCDVRTLSTLVKAGLEKGFVDLADSLKFARVNKSRGSMLTLLSLLNIDYPYSLYNYQVYRAFAHLSSTTIRRISNGEQLEVRFAPRQTRDALNKLLMSNVLWVQTGRGGRNGIEPTTAFVDGVPLSAVISGSRTTRPVVIAHREVEPGETVRSIEGTRMMAYVSGMKKIVTDGELLGFATGEAFGLSFRFDYAPGAWHSYSLHDISVRPRQALTAYESLPDEVRRVVDAYRRAHQYKAGGLKRH
ncbi:MAG: hypothetical protein IH945_12210 [Armatimonadetes bacterium]|nr:hypothetical protein [Armatimonadota bacterium]